MLSRPRLGLVLLAVMSLDRAAAAGPPAPTRRPLDRVVDLDLGESQQVELCDGSNAQVKLLGLDERRDPIRDAVRQARVQVAVNGQTVELISATYHLPRTVAGVQVDCPITRGYSSNTDQDHWGLAKAARLRLWPAGSPWVEPGTFVYPVRQRWFASMTQMANEPTYVDEFEDPSRRRIYYHSGLDIGGAEGLADVLAAAAGLVVSVGKAALPGYEGTPTDPRYDVAYVLDDRGWYYRYSHLQSFDPAIQPGVTVALGQKIGVLGKEGGSGGWSHLHFEIVSRQPSGRWGTQEGYAFLWEAALREQQPAVVAVARPHHVVQVGERVPLDGTGSWTRSGRVTRYDWTFSDGTTASGPRVERTYSQPGEYSEILKVSDDQGHIAYDFAVVQVHERTISRPLPPSIHAAYSPTQNIHPEEPVTFKVRTFGTTDGSETWDFGDGTPPVQVRSDGNVQALAPDGYAITTHRFARPGDYLPRVERTDRRGRKATARLWVQVRPER
ncbi:MAG TPA: PKD domain-containing protein [Isosphaeraceae bacterium]|nr:PKD domain-containing protein [Isosphaeraceae bacterium]